MKFFCLTTLIILTLNSCHNKTLQLLNKKWDCVKIENLDPVKNKPFDTPQDSAIAVKLETSLTELNWIFNNNHSYECGIGDKTTIRGTYTLSENEKTLVCTPDSKNTINQYNITRLTEDELILSSRVNNTNIVLHFRSH